jgi:cytoskeletal protein RodZ
MNKLYVLLMFIALVAYVACQRQRMEEQAQDQHQVTQDEANTREKAAEMISTPASSASPSMSPENRYDLKSQAQKFQPRRIVPMNSPISETPTPTPTEETSPLQSKVPQPILEPILNKAAELAKVAREQLVMVRAESAVWNDGSLGCPEPGMMYTQAIVNGYWVVIEAEGQKYDFRVGSGGSFRLCPPGRGQPPSQPAAN